MNENTLTLINQKVKEFAFLDFSIFEYRHNELVIAISTDFTYYHLFEIRFKNVFSVICNTLWSVDTQKDVIKVVDSTEAYDLNVQYGVEVGYSIFQLMNEDELELYVIAESVEFRDHVVKYFDDRNE
ncbi:hypothetical protein DCC81_05750 [Chitinophaga parva]|uniref:Uncharacterized protein n=1 Tax=Chitinophaga parva TaxID=2169414 RepID=A0A2T7BMR9_9BACT|nr:hypothetical protein [Chitinophaga parva]PUZ28974.1 hypothetical protein DCC81_05750 [Chitinophaga parva]